MMPIYMPTYDRETGKQTGNKISFEGAVLTTRERNYYDDSDFYAVVWDEKEGRLRDIEYATTRFGGSGSARVDATDEVKRKARRWLIRWGLERLQNREKLTSLDPLPGREVIVSAGRKLPLGLRGKVFWRGKSNHRFGGERIGIIVTEDPTGKLAKNTKVFTAADNATVIDPDKYMSSWTALARKAIRWLGGPNECWHYPFSEGMVMM